MYLNRHCSARWRTVDEQNDAGSKESWAAHEFLGHGIAWCKLSHELAQRAMI
jgi:hypothetical protein